MPTTYNGVGTHYYGHKNASQRTGNCPHCHRQATLESYDTRLWFVILFIPVIPLGRKRILDQCKACSVHQAVESDRWEATKQIEVSGAQEKFRTDPTVEHGIALHQQLLRFQQHAEAAAFRATLVSQFAEHAKVQAHLGVVLDRLGQNVEAQLHFRHALKLRADLPEARVGLARVLLREDRLDEARALLDFLERPGAGQLYPLDVLETLGLAYQKAGKHEQSLQLFGHLAEEFPHIHEHSGFRKMVAVSERALGRAAPLLPKVKFSWQRFVGLKESPDGSHRNRRFLALLGAVSVAVSVFVPVHSHWVRNHRTVHVLNGFSVPAQVEFRGLGRLEAPPGLSTFTLAEGNHHASVRGPVTEEVDFPVGEEFGAGGLRPVWLLNLGGEAIFQEIEAIYSSDPQPGSATVHFGESFVWFPSVNYPFEELPKKVQVGRSGGQRVLTALEAVKAPTAAVVEYLHRKGDTQAALKLCEFRLPRDPQNSALVNDYVGLCSQQFQLGRAVEFFRQGLTNRPVSIVWHRAYQNLRQSLGDTGLRAIYDGFLREQPEDSALLYLRARIEPNQADAQAMFERSRRADPQNPFPWFALGWHQYSLGQWAAARTNFTQAAQLDSETEDFRGFLRLTRLAMGEALVLEKEARAKLDRMPWSVMDAFQLLDALEARGRMEEAVAVVRGVREAVRQQEPARTLELTLPLEWHRLYLAGDFAGLEQATRGGNTPQATNHLAIALVEQGKVREATALHGMESTNLKDPAYLLTLSLAARAAGDAAEAGRWLDQAQFFFARHPEKSPVSELLSPIAHPTLADVASIKLPVQERMLVLLALARIHPVRATEFTALARHLNVERSFPYQLVRRLTAGQIPARP